MPIDERPEIQRHKHRAITRTTFPAGQWHPAVPGTKNSVHEWGRAEPRPKFIRRARQPFEFCPFPLHLKAQHFKRGAGHFAEAPFDFDFCERNRRLGGATSSVACLLSRQRTRGQGDENQKLHATITSSTSGVPICSRITRSRATIENHCHRERRKRSMRPGRRNRLAEAQFVAGAGRDTGANTGNGEKPCENQFH